METRTIRKKEKYDINLDEIGFEKQYSADNVIAGKIFFWICIAFPVLLFIAYILTGSPSVDAVAINALIWGLLAFLNFVSEHQDDIILTNGPKNISFYRNKPNEDEVLRFIDEIIETSKKFLKQKYIVMDDVDEEDFHSRIKWLKARDVISESEYSLLKEEFNKRRLL